MYRPAGYIKCSECGEVIWSEHVHDWHACKCKGVFVDGGSDYLRYGNLRDGVTPIPCTEDGTPLPPPEKVVEESKVKPTEMEVHVDIRLTDGSGHQHSPDPADVPDDYFVKLANGEGVRLKDWLTMMHCLTYLKGPVRLEEK